MKKAILVLVDGMRPDALRACGNPGVEEMLQALQQRGYHLGVISNNASLYNVFNVLEDYGIRKYMDFMASYRDIASDKE